MKLHCKSTLLSYRRLLGLLFLSAVFQLVALQCAFADEVLVCNAVGAIPGQHVTDLGAVCADDLVPAESSDLFSFDLVFACDGNSSGPNCPSLGGFFTLVQAGSGKVYSIALDSFVLASTMTWGSGATSSSSSSSASSTTTNPYQVPDLTWSQWGAILTAILGLFVTVAIIRFVRKNV